MRNIAGACVHWDGTADGLSDGFQAKGSRVIAHFCAPVITTTIETNGVLQTQIAWTPGLIELWCCGSQMHNRANPKVLRTPKFCFGCFEFHLCKIFAKAPKKGGGLFHFCDFFLRNSVLRSCCWHTESILFIFVPCFAPHLIFLGGSCFIHFGTTAKDLGSLGRWNCRHNEPPYLLWGTAN